MFGGQVLGSMAGTLIWTPDTRRARAGQACPPSVPVGRPCVARGMRIRERSSHIQTHPPGQCLPSATPRSLSPRLSRCRCRFHGDNDGLLHRMP